MGDNLPEGVSLHELKPEAFIAQLDTIIGIYEEAKGVPANCTMMTRHAGRPGFRCIIAKHDDTIIGFIYGMKDGRRTGLKIPGSPVAWGSHDLLDVAIANDLLPQCWAGAFDIVEVHVLPAWQNKKIGRRLIRALCNRLHTGKVALIAEANSRARSLYQQFGFTDLPNPRRRVCLMGRSLPLPDP